MLQRSEADAEAFNYLHKWPAASDSEIYSFELPAARLSKSKQVYASVRRQAILEFKQVAQARLMPVKCDSTFHRRPHQEHHARNARKWICHDDHDHDDHDNRCKVFRALVTTGA